MATFGAKVTQVAHAESTDPTTLVGKVTQAFAAQLTAHNPSQLIDAYLTGGGAGGAYMVALLFSTLESGNFPNLADQHAAIVFGPDPHTLQTKVNAFLAAHPGVQWTFIDLAAAGAGGLFAELIIWQNATTTSFALTERDIEALALSDLEHIQKGEADFAGMLSRAADEFAEPVTETEEATVLANRKIRAKRKVKANQKRLTTPPPKPDEVIDLDEEESSDVT